MGDAVIAALITGGISLIGIIVSTIWQTKQAAKKTESNYQKLLSELKQQSREDDLKLQAKIENFQAVTNAKIEELTREVREHNQFAQRVPVVEEKVKVLERQVARLDEKVHA